MPDLLNNIKGNTTTTLTKSDEAIDAFRKTPGDFDVVITDMTMPNMNGDKLAAELLAIRPDIPIILCTGFNEHISESEAEQIGIAAFAMKPLSIQKLAHIVRQVLQMKKA